MFFIKDGIIFESLEDVYEYYHDVVKIVNLKQYLFYASNCGIQADWVCKSPYDGRLVAYYGKERTNDCWERWKHYENKEEN